ncbi:MAG: ribonuclease E/G [Pseudomonadota bacterium]
MKGRVLVIDGPARGAALISDGRLQDLIFDAPEGQAVPGPGEIYRAKVDRLVPGMGGAFVRLTDAHQGFLRETKGLKQGGEILVQVSSHAEPGKAVPVSRRPLLKSRRVILTPGAPGINASRGIKDTELRRRLSAEVTLDAQDIGLILRTAARGAEPAHLSAEAAHLLAVWREIEAGGAGRLWHMDAATTALCEWTDPLPDAIHCFGFPRQVIEKYTEIMPLVADMEPAPFEAFGVWEAVERLRAPESALPSGGMMAVEATRAMVTVDVNTGPGFSAGAAMTTNIEAARELPRQLRLRGLGGQITVDFAPLKKMHRKKIEEVLRSAFRTDPVETSLAGWTPLGHFELQRKRERRPLTEILNEI